VLYNSETWTVKENQKRKLKTFETAVLRKICGITRRDRRWNVDMLKELQIEKVKFYIDLLVDLSRMEKDRYPHILLHGYTLRHPPRGRPWKKWLDNIREDCEY